MSAGITPDGLRSQRKNPSVLKGDLAKLREKDRCLLVIVIEGKEDLPVYEVWLTRLFESMQWEPMVANGKRNALQFREIARRDKTGIAVCTFFIVDHDYDGISGAESDSDIFVLPAHSIENYLSGEGVFESFLRTDLRIVGDPSDRARLVGIFTSLKAEIIELVEPVSAALYGARNESVGNVSIRPLPRIVEMHDDSIRVIPGLDLADILMTDRAVSAPGIDLGRAFLAENDKSLWIRGKFLYEFFKQVCVLLYEDRKSEKPLIFKEPSTDHSFSPGSLDFRSLAAKSSIPAGLSERIKEWTQRCQAECSV